VQTVRDEAALALRMSYQSIPETKWLPTFEKIKQGQSKVEILEVLHPFHVTIEEHDGSGQSHIESYRLDDEWLLRCWYQNNGDILTDRRLALCLKTIWIAPLKDFTGTWTVYFVNGQKSHDINYKNGLYFGEFIAYHSNGVKSYVQHYAANTIICRESIGYYPSGKIAYKGQYRDGKQAGTWTHYAEDGSITSTQEYPNP
jgi:hypothetical protein